MGLPSRRDDEHDLDDTDEFLIAALEQLDQQLQAIRDQVQARAFARARAARLAHEPRVQDMIAESAARHADDSSGEPDSPELLDERLDRLAQ